MYATITSQGRAGRGRYTNTAKKNPLKYPKFVSIYLNLIEALYTVYPITVISKASDIPNIPIIKLKYTV